MILVSLAAAVLAFQEPAPPLVRKVWYEVAEAQLTCTTLADESERRSLNATFLENPGDSSNRERYFRDTVQDERTPLDSCHFGPIQLLQLPTYPVLSALCTPVGSDRSS